MLFWGVSPCIYPRSIPGAHGPMVFRGPGSAQAEQVVLFIEQRQTRHDPQFRVPVQHVQSWVTRVNRPGLFSEGGEVINLHTVGSLTIPT